jgi:hypothetical protein
MWYQKRIRDGNRRDESTVNEYQIRDMRIKQQKDGVTGRVVESNVQKESGWWKSRFGLRIR